MPLVVRLLAQRIALGLLLLFLVSILIFAGTNILPGDVAASILGQSATPEALANLRRDLGLNDAADRFADRPTAQRRPDDRSRHDRHIFEGCDL